MVPASLGDIVMTILPLRLSLDKAEEVTKF